jgi:hypothetical protein
MKLVYLQFVVHPEVNKKCTCKSGRQTNEVYYEGTFEAFEVPEYEEEVM